VEPIFAAALADDPAEIAAPGTVARPGQRCSAIAGKVERA
jgi:hypothetical protein